MTGTGPNPLKTLKKQSFKNSPDKKFMAGTLVAEQDFSHTTISFVFKDREASLLALEPSKPKGLHLVLPRKKPNVLARWLVKLLLGWRWTNYEDTPGRTEAYWEPGLGRLPGNLHIQDCIVSARGPGKTNGVQL